MEIMAVLKHDDQSTRRLEDSASDLSQLSTQTVFSMLDHLTQWARHKFQMLNAEKNTGQSRKDRSDLKSMWCLFFLNNDIYFFQLSIGFCHLGMQCYYNMLVCFMICCYQIVISTFFHLKTIV